MGTRLYWTETPPLRLLSLKKKVKDLKAKEDKLKKLILEEMENKGDY